MVPIIFLIWLWFRPSWERLKFFTLGTGVLVGAIGLLKALTAPAEEDYPLWAKLIDVLINAAIYVAVFWLLGFLIVKFKEPGRLSSKEKALDEEMARIRAEIAARDESAPPKP